MKTGMAAVLVCAVLLLCSGCATVADKPAMIGAGDFDRMITVTVTPVEHPLPEELRVAALAP